MVNTVRKISCLFFLVWRQWVKKDVLKVFSWHCYSAWKVKAIPPPLQHQAIHVPAPEWRAGYETSKTVSLRNWRSAKRRLPSACEVFMYIVETGVKRIYMDRWKGNLVLLRGPVVEEVLWQSFFSGSFKIDDDMQYWANSHQMQNNFCVRIYWGCEELQSLQFTAVNLLLLL